MKNIITIINMIKLLDNKYYYQSQNREPATHDKDDNDTEHR